MKYIDNISKFLRAYTENEFRISTTRVRGCLDDIRFDAARAGFDVYRDFDKEAIKNHKFADIYVFIRK